MTTLGFTNYGRPVLAYRITDITDLPDGENCEVTVEPVTIKPSLNPQAQYTLVGANLRTIAGNLKSFAFAKSAALRWSAMLGESVAVYQQADECLELAEVVRAHEMSAEDFAQASLLAEIGRMTTAIDSLREVEMDVRAMREDAEAALLNVKQLADTDDALIAPVAEVARAAAEVFECVMWSVLITPADADMIGELSATS